MRKVGLASVWLSGLGWSEDLGAWLLCGLVLPIPSAFSPPPVSYSWPLMKTGHKAYAPISAKASLLGCFSRPQVWSTELHPGLGMLLELGWFRGGGVLNFTSEDNVASPVSWQDLGASFLSCSTTDLCQRPKWMELWTAKCDLW